MSDPFNGSTQGRFDAVMQQIATQYSGQAVTIHIGPGEFETKGYAISGGWQIKAGMRIVGAGRHVTTLKLAEITSVTDSYVIGHDLDDSSRADFAEVSDLTIDCQLPGGEGFSILGAVRLMGHHVKIRRVQAVNWGAEAGGPCLVFSVVPVALDSMEEIDLAYGGIEECLVVEPAAGHNGSAIAFHVGGDDESFTLEYHGKSPYIRNCYVDPGLESEGTVAGLAMDWCRGGVMEGNQIYNTSLAGVWMDGEVQPPHSIRDLIVRNNFFKNVVTGLRVALGADEDPIDTSGSLSRSGAVATISDISTTNLVVGDRVLLATDPTTFDGVYVVRAIIDSTTFTVDTTVTTDTTAAVDSVRMIRGIGRLIFEGNVVELTAGEEAVAVEIEDDNDTSPYPEEPDFVHGDVIIRNNKVRYVDGLDAVAPDDEGAKLIDVSGVKHLMVQNNVLHTVAALPLQNRRCRHATYFNNRTPSGGLVRGWDDDLDRKYDELETEAEDAFLLAMLNER